MSESLAAPWIVARHISQARILEHVAISFTRGSSWPRDWTHVSCLAGRILPLSHQGSQSCQLGYSYKLTKVIYTRLDPMESECFWRPRLSKTGRNIMRAEGTAGSGKGGISECLGQRTSVRNWNCLYRYIIKMVQLHFCLLLSYVFSLSPFGSFKRGA